MDREYHDIMVVLTADRDCLERVRRLSRSRNHGWLWWQATDPGDLLAALYPATAPQPDPVAFHLVGAVLDLTSPAALSGSPSPDPGTLDLAWRLAVMLVLQKNGHHPPVLVMSGEPGVDERLRRVGLAVAAQVAHEADDAAWRRALRSLVVHEPPAPHAAESPHATQGAIPSDAAIPLGAGLWFEPRQCALLRNGHSIALTAREHAVLEFLLRLPGQCVSTRTLANHLSYSAGRTIDDHCVEQTISGLRRKLGEPARSSRLLENRRGVGYRIVPRTSAPSGGGAAAGSV